MKKLLPLFLLIILIVICYKYSHFALWASRDKSNNRNKIIITPTKGIGKKQIATEITNRSIFVPYWNINEDLQKTNYDKYIYFGITANNQGVNKEEIGFSKLSSFAKMMEGKDTYLTLRLLDNDFNHNLLKDTDLQQKIIEQTLVVTKENNFKGVVLDLELFSLLNTEISNQINVFVQKFYTALKSNYKSFDVAVYGDTFYRKRPYDLVFIGQNCDEVLVMAYDFSKSIGEPGPNFPYEIGPDNNYSFKKMISDFKSNISKEKISVIFGMYGYDWKVDAKKRPITTAKALTLKEIKKEFLDNCQWKDCVVKRDALSKETEIDYVYSIMKDDVGYMDYHIVWFEDEESVKVKTKYLQEQEIESIGYWVWGYF